MKQWLTRLVAIAVVVAIIFWLWQAFFPGNERVIRTRVARVAKLMSFSQDEGNITGMVHISSLLEYFTTDVECFIETPDIPEAGDWTIKGRRELRDVILSSHENVSSLTVQFIDVTIAIAPDKTSAAVELTARVSLPHDKDFIVHEMKFTFKKVDGQWLISRVETVKTLT
jgi:hypothetical protein